MTILAGRARTGQRYNTMDQVLKDLQKERVRLLLINLAYFVILLLVGGWIFLFQAGMAGYLLATACVVLYVLTIRPIGRGHIRRMRETILRYGLCGGLEDFLYQPHQGVGAQEVQACGLVPTTSPKSFYSRELVTGKKDGMEVTIADVTFPIQEKGRNAMFSGCFLSLTCSGAQMVPVTVKAGKLSNSILKGKSLALAKQMGELIPGSLYLHMEGEKAWALLRGRFVGYPINPLFQVTKNTLVTDPLPEVACFVELVQSWNKASYKGQAAELCTDEAGESGRKERRMEGT